MSNFQTISVAARFPEAMRVLFPNADGASDYLVAQTESGPMLVAWNLSNDIPTDAQISAALVTVDWTAVRTKRDTLLAQCDWTQMPDSPLSSAKRSDWATYRAALRNLPESASDPSQVTWPSAPTGT